MKYINEVPYQIFLPFLPWLSWRVFISLSSNNNNIWRRLSDRFSWSFGVIVYVTVGGFEKRSEDYY